MPKLFWINDGGKSFVPLPAMRRFYYFLGRVNTETPVSAFPKGLRMVIGDPMAKDNSKWATAPTGGGQFTYTCHVDTDLLTNNIYQETFNFARDCPYGIRIESKFPSCWDGVNLYTSDMSHMTWPVGPNAQLFNGACPASHPIKVPQIMLEYTYHPSAYSPAVGKATSGNLMWATGDTTGYSIHADFAEGWDTEALSAAINDQDCGNRGSSFPFPDCDIWKKFYDPDSANACKPEFGTMEEPTGGNVDLTTISALPGCNLPWASGSKPTCPAPTASPDVTPFEGSVSAMVVASNSSTAGGNNALAIGSDGYADVACVSDSFSTFFDINIAFTDSNMTLSSCRDSCARSGYRYSAVGLRASNFVCNCGDELLASAPLQPGSCTSKCPGDSSEICGGPAVRSVSYNANPDITLGDSGMYSCYYDPIDPTQGLPGASQYQFTSASMTWDTCTSSCKTESADYTWAAIWRSNTCMCGSDVKMGGMLFVPLDMCSMGCTGDKNQVCGGPFALTVFSLTGDVLIPLNGTAIPPPGTSQGSTGASVASASSVVSTTVVASAATSVKATVVASGTSAANATATADAEAKTLSSSIAATGSKTTVASADPAGNTIVPSSANNTTVVPSTAQNATLPSSVQIGGGGVALAQPTSTKKVCSAMHKRRVRRSKRHGF